MNAVPAAAGQRNVLLAALGTLVGAASITLPIEARIERHVARCFRTEQEREISAKLKFQQIRLVYSSAAIQLSA